MSTEQIEQRPDEFVIGVDYGTLSGRAVVVRVRDGAELGSAVFEYPHAVISDRLPGTNRQLPPDWALQVPTDYVDVLKNAVPQAIAAAGVDAAQVIGIGTDFTACTMLPTTEDGTPLCELAEFAIDRMPTSNCGGTTPPNPRQIGSTSSPQARGEAWLPRYGGIHLVGMGVREGPASCSRTTPRSTPRWSHWVEAADWIVWQLGGRYVRNACAAGYKGILQDGQYPDPDFLAALNPEFAGFVTDKLEHPDRAARPTGWRLTTEAAEWTGLPAGIAVAVGNVDAHVAAPAAASIAPVSWWRSWGRPPAT